MARYPGWSLPPPKAAAASRNTLNDNPPSPRQLVAAPAAVSITSSGSVWTTWQNSRGRTDCDRIATSRMQRTLRLTEKQNRCRWTSHSVLSKSRVIHSTVKVKVDRKCSSHARRNILCINHIDAYP